MSFRFTARLPLSRHRVDRDHLRRTETELFPALWADAATRILPVWRGRVLLADDAAAPRLLLLAPSALADPATALRLYLGRSLDPAAAEPVGSPLVAVLLSDEEAAALQPEEGRWLGLRDLATVLADRDTGLLAEALGLANWHRSHAHCPRCGTATAAEDGGWVRRCPNCGNQVFPRTDPAVIVLITDAEDRLLLGSNALWEHNRYSLLAGFVEPGESLEAAVIREMFEESGLRVSDPVYLGSQPWPFPASIMLGFTARLAAGTHASEILPDGEEILDLRWFSRAELRAAREQIILPGPASIARAMIDDWLERGPRPPETAP